jgi:hypothetical protein
MASGSLREAANIAVKAPKIRRPEVELRSGCRAWAEPMESRLLPHKLRASPGHRARSC